MSSKSLFRWIFSSHTPSEEPSAMPNPVENLLPDSPSQPELDHAPPTPSPPDLDGSSGDQLHFELGRLDVREPDASQSEAEKGFGGESGGVRLIDESGEPEPEPEPERQRDGAQQVEEEEEEEEQSGGEKNNGDFGQCEEDEKKDERTRVSNYPVRPEAEDCSFYLKTGTCKFASNCKFNHPVQRKNQAAKDKLKEKEEAKERTGQMECKFYLKMGGCKYGKACRYSHTRPKAPVAPFVELNFLGLPIRPGEKECPFYMRNGSCKYAFNCRYNHPDPTAGGGEPHSEYSNGGSASLQSASQFAGASWSSPGALNESASFVPMMYSPTHGMSSPNAEWNGYQFHVNPPGQVMRPPLPYVMKNPVTEGHMYPPHQQQMFVDEFPERPGQPDCSYFLKTGECKFKANCKYHHPKDRISKSPAVVLSDKGLPLRPDQNICSYYSRYGICKFGPACKFDHPIHLASSTMSGLDHHQPSSAANSASIDGPIMDGSWDSNDATVQQSV